MQPLRHGYTNDTVGDGATVLKRYRGHDRRERRDTEARMLTALAGRLPVPRLIGVSGDTVTMSFIAGVQGQELIEAGHAREVLRSCGGMLRRIPPAHGDYGPQNTLFDPASFAVTAVLDWEWAHDGDPIEDLAWCEWIVRTHHPSRVDALPALFDGYGRRPPWRARQAAALAKCRQMRDRPGADPVWRDRVEATAAWTE
jgi:aminoglycoside phosphotransferase (APT) family kinase protein